jgi:hypothetical protein
MDQTLYQQNQIELRVTDIQYLPYHRCPNCGASARTTETGEWIRPYQDWFRTALSNWLDHLGYVYFQCVCQHHKQFKSALRIARLGDAIIPVHFDDGTLARQFRDEPAVINADRVRQAVNYLAKNANPAFTVGNDWLAHELHALATGGISLGVARREMQTWIDRQVESRLQKDRTKGSDLEFNNLDMAAVRVETE